ncbi:MAG TPA: hypothetical protein VIX20_00985 [Ktedonobacteraceae bacterium]
MGAVALGDQIHDFNPGLSSNGVFWTIRIPDENVEVDLEDATASMRLSDAEISDFFSLTNFFSGGKSIHADVSFRMHWSGIQKRVHLHDEQNEFDAHVIEDTATLAWSAEEEGFKFVSDPEDTSTTVFAEIGQERNGVFF